MRPHWFLAISLQSLWPGAMVGLFLFVPPVGAQEKADFWLREELQKPAAAAQLVAGYHPVTIWPIYRYQRWWVWFLPEEEPPRFDGKFAPSLNPELLRTLAELDAKTVPDLTKRKGTRAELNFIKLYREAMLNAARVPKEAFAEWAKDFDYVTWAHLYNQPREHYGKMVTVAGKLLRLRKYDAPGWFQDRGIPFIYEAWVQGPTDGANPFAVEFVHPPEKIKVAESHSPSPHVLFHGYFLGRYRYRGGSQKDFVTPLLVGPTIESIAPPPEAEKTSTPVSPLAALVLYGILGVVCLVTVLMVGLNWWFRKGDQEVRNRLAQIQAERALENLEAGGPFLENDIRPEENGLPGRTGENASDPRDHGSHG